MWHEREEEVYRVGERKILLRTKEKSATALVNLALPRGGLFHHFREGLIRGGDPLAMKGRKAKSNAGHQKENTPGSR